MIPLFAALTLGFAVAPILRLVRPHLHVGAVAAGSNEAWPNAHAMPLTVDGRYLIINDVVRAPARH